jgi:N-carbamoylputrescine amidase
MVKVAMVQFSGHSEKEENLQKILHYSAEAARNGAKIICHQELANTIYFCFEEDYKHYALAEPIPGPSTERVGEFAKQASVMVILPLYEKVIKGECYNSAAVISPDGKVIGKYQKNSIPLMKTTDGPLGNEKFYFRPGRQGFPVFETPFGIRIGILICYDRHFPEAFRVLALQGADIIFVPTATYRQTIRDMWEVELRANAFMNVLYVGGVNRVGQDSGGAPERHYFGSSVFVDPKGTVISRASDREEQIIYADVDVDRIEDLRNRLGFYRDRRPEVYGLLCQ